MYSLGGVRFSTVSGGQLASRTLNSGKVWSMIGSHSLACANARPATAFKVCLNEKQKEYEIHSMSSYWRFHMLKATDRVPT